MSTFLASSLLLTLMLPLSMAAQPPIAPQTTTAAQQPGGPNSGPAPAPPVLTGDAVQHPGVPVGKLSEKLTLRSQIYDGMLSDYWIYVPAQYDPQKPAAVMVFQDGAGYINRHGDHPALNVLDNLISKGKIPIMIAIFTDPGDISGSPGTPTYKVVEARAKKWSYTMKTAMRGTEYDVVSDRYPRFLHDELIPEVAKQYNLRSDAYSRAITGLSSGGICAFNAGWQRPDDFSRIITWIGSFTAIQWHETPEQLDGGQDFPAKILREEHRNIRVWLQDGNNDQENPQYGSWPMGNISMANALKLKGYDFHFSFGKGPHTAAEGGAEFAQEMIWLWRSYDPAKTSETFVQDPDEAVKPPFRVTVFNREP
ncbi:esterase family protein [Granulicella sp. WH15]|uniref:alpha/beta hydrolase n=1 Tax=Granulicella sp. WH15 TaxID=2602070 RepID=UPI001366B215|nr:alpha/beta hydrolase-fold protein [Granulicella sp. WH15]QHN03583.1 esterase family protein [Granulicella sp. WH15]